MVYLQEEFKEEADKFSDYLDNELDTPLSSRGHQQALQTG